MSCRICPGAASASRCSLLLAIWIHGALACAPPKVREAPFKVALTEFPKRLDPFRTLLGGFHYIDLQLYQPLTERSVPSGELTSQLLDIERTRAHSSQMLGFTLCIRKSVAFVDGSPVTSDDLLSSLKQIHAAQSAFPALVSAAIDADCVRLELSHPDPLYLDRLSTASTTVVKAGTEQDRVPLGTGPYKVESWSTRRLRLRHRDASADIAYPVVDFVTVRSFAEALKMGVEDTNLLIFEPAKGQARQEMRRTPQTTLRTVALIASYLDPNTRHRVGTCLRVDALREALDLDLVPLPGFLPRGVPGWDVRFERGRSPEFSCTPATGERLIFYNHVPTLQRRLQEFFDGAEHGLPYSVEVRLSTVEETLSAAARGEPMLYLLGFGAFLRNAATSAEPTVFFEAFANNRLCSAEIFPAETRLYSVWHASRYDKRLAYTDAHRALLASGCVVPLGQPPSYFFYPRSVGELDFGTALMSFPLLDRSKRG